jgi:hypothetical protein
VASAERADHAPGSRKVESILIAATALPFAGEAETGISVGAVMRKGLQTLPSSCRPDDQGVLDLLRRRGTPNALSRACPRGGTEYLRSWRIGPYYALSHCFTHPRRNRRWNRGIASHAASRRAAAFGAPPSGRLVLPGRRCRWCGVARCLLSLGRGRAVACRALRRKRTGSGGQRNGTGSPIKRGPPVGAGEDRTLEVVLARR